MENVMGSFFTKDELPQYCFTLYSLWGNPDKKRERIPKGSIMKLHFYLNASRRAGPHPRTGEWDPLFNTPTTPSLQIAIHSPYFLPSPYNDGSTFTGGRSYELRVLMGVVQKCRADLYNEQWGCVPLYVDYPHTYSICRNDFKNVTLSAEECTDMVDNYNQPCDSISYEVTKEEVEITVVRQVVSIFNSNKPLSD
ncbi:uncharacterized protein TNCT_433481 [Trichonephila clavata]|uniref:Uncharacterized protein n=1 Tax=Trichonephila clavata TaxID=2740835 RepID=A0A8X6JDM6_TRICU|nr:uncharacterized protein TNCT_433481 [Trichonephila clavata]